jgi:hypothetical protein
VIGILIKCSTPIDVLGIGDMTHTLMDSWDMTDTLTGHDRGVRCSDVAVYPHVGDMTHMSHDSM